MLTLPSKEAMLKTAVHAEFLGGPLEEMVSVWEPLAEALAPNPAPPMSQLPIGDRLWANSTKKAFQD